VKILHLTDLFWPNLGGTEQNVRDVAAEQLRRGYDVAVATLNTTPGAGSQVEADGYLVHRLLGTTRHLGVWTAPDKPYHPPFPDPLVARALRRIVTEHRPDVVHAHNWMAYSYLAVKTRSSPPLLWTQHDYSLECPKKTRWYHEGDHVCPGSSLTNCVPCSAEQYGRPKGAAITIGLRGANAALLGRVDRYAANSSPVALAAHEVLAPRREVRVTGEDIDLGLVAVANAAARPSYLPEGPFILFVGQLSGHKGIHDLLAAYAQLTDAPPLVVLGTPQPDTPTTWPDNVIVRQHVPHDEVMAAWRDCAFGVVPSLWAEPFGIVALEAAIMGKAIVATRVGGLADLVVDHESGLQVDRANPDALAAAMRVLIDDPALAARLGDVAKARAPRYSIGVVADALDEIMREMLASRAP
jgi:glycosyltransferase involved in cell wall biosynthesis